MYEWNLLSSKLTAFNEFNQLGIDPVYCINNILVTDFL